MPAPALRLPASAPAARRPALRLVPPAAPLTEVERHAVALGRDDARRFGWDGGLGRTRLRRRLDAVLGRLTGVRGVTPLADPRLELFRLFGATMRRADRRADAIAARLAALGVAPPALREAIGVALG